MANKTSRSQSFIKIDTSDTSQRYITDVQIRDAGYEIVARPRKGPTLWRRKSDKRVMAEKRILEILNRGGLST